MKRSDNPDDIFFFNKIILAAAAGWAATTVLLLVGRLLFFVDYLPENFFKTAGLPETGRVFLMSFRHDLSVSGIVLSPVLLTTLLLSPFRQTIHKFWQRITVAWISASLALTTAIMAADHFFYYYYQDHYNIFFWEFWLNWENSKLALWSILDEIPPAKPCLLLLFFIACGPGLFFWLKNKSESLSRLKWLNKKRFLIPCLFVSLVAARGTFQSLPLVKQRYKGLISSHHHLNLISANPVYELYFSWREVIGGDDNNYVKKMLLRDFSEVKEWFKSTASLNKQRRLRGNKPKNIRLEYETPALRRAHLKRKPKHIVLLFLESQSEWATLYREDGFNQKIAAEFLKLKKESIYFDRYFQAASGTFSNIISVNLGVPDHPKFLMEGVKEILKYFPDTLPRVLKKLGYKTIFFYGGSLAWHRSYNLMKKLGYEELYGESHLPDAPKTRFGVYDWDLYQFIHRKLLKAKEPTFSFVMTLSNHPPYNLPESFMAGKTIEVPAGLRRKLNDRANFRKRFKAFKYADQSLGKFMKLARSAPYFKDTLFILTSDHSHPFNLTWREEERYVQRQLPLMLYAPELIKKYPQVINTPGSHLDITPTLLSIIQDEPTTIQNWGKSLLTAREGDLYFNYHFACQAEICFYNKAGYRLQDDLSMTQISGREPPEINKLKSLHQALMNSGLFYLMKYEDPKRPQIAPLSFGEAGPRK